MVKVWSSIKPGLLLTEDKVLDDLRISARDIQPKILRREIMEYANEALVSRINVSFDPAAEDISLAIFKASERSVERVAEAVRSRISLDALKTHEQTLRNKYTESFADGSWRQSLPGREILKRYVENQQPGIGYEPFKNLVLAQMIDVGHQPLGMKSVIDAVMSA